MKTSLLKPAALVLVTASLTYMLTIKMHPGAGQSTKAIQKIRSSDSVLYASTVYPLDSAKMDISNFLQVASACLPGDSLIRGYSIHSTDLFDAMGMNGHDIDSAYCRYKYVRVYLGYRLGSGYKLFIVPVKDSTLPGRDIMLDSSGHPDPAGQFVLDLITPCPSVCDNNSPLVQLTQNSH